MDISVTLTTLSLFKSPGKLGLGAARDFIRMIAPMTAKMIRNIPRWEREKYDLWRRALAISLWSCGICFKVVVLILLGVPIGIDEAKITFPVG